MNDPSVPGFPRVAHEPEGDSGETPAATSGTAPPERPERSSDPTGFRFNLDDALARLSEPHQPMPRFQWSTVTPSETPPLPTPMHGTSLTGSRLPAPPPSTSTGTSSLGSMFPDQESRVRPLTQPTLDPLPEIRLATPVDGTPTAHWSTIPVPAPPPLVAPPEPAVEAATAETVTILTGSDAFGAGANAFTPAYSPPAGVVLGRRADDGLPRLPASDPAAAPPMATMTSVTKVAPAVRSAAAVRGRKKKKRHRAGKLILAVFVLAGLVGAALMYGRDYLFPEDWAKDVVPTVDALQLTTGLEFADPVAVNDLPAVEYSARVAGIMFGPVLDAEWPTSVPRWRALGLVDGDPSVDAVATAVSAWKPAFYDPADGQIYRDASATGTVVEIALREALASALVDQLAVESPAPPADATDPVTVASPTESLSRLAVAGLEAELLAGPRTSQPDRTTLGALPVPLAHRLIGAADLGAPILTSLGVVPDRETAIAGFDVAVGSVLDVPLIAAPVPALLEGDLQDGDAVSRGSDFWYTVFAAYLPADIAASTADAIGADLYVPALHGAQQCVYGTFSPASPDLLGVLQIGAVSWVALAPTQAVAQATTLADGVTVQLSTCDPGTAPDVVRVPDVAAALVARQIARLTPV